MKIGDLVRWTHPKDESVGIILEVISLPNQYGDGQVVIDWLPSSKNSKNHRGVYPARHQYMEHNLVHPTVISGT